MSEEEQLAASPSSPRDSVKLFLGGLSWETTEEKIRSHFERFGSIEEVIVMRDTVTKKPRGFGFITFSDSETADLVCKEQHLLDNRQIDAKRSVPQEQKPKSKKIFVGGLAPETTEGQFREYFEQFGRIADAQIMQDHLSGRSRGFGFVTFEDDNSVEKVFATGTMHDISGKRVEVKTATPRGSGPLGRATAPIGRPLQRGGIIVPGQGNEYGVEMNPSQMYSVPQYGVAYPPGMVQYGVPYSPYGYSNMYMGYNPYGFQQYHPGFQVQQGPALSDPRQQAMQFQIGQANRNLAASAQRPYFQSPSQGKPPQR